MGRRPNAPIQKADGYWYCRHPGLKRTVRLTATSFAEACAEQQSFYGVDIQTAQMDEIVPSNPVPTDGGNGGNSVISLDDDKPSSSTDKSAADMLASWSSDKTSSNTPPPAPQPTVINIDSPAAPKPAGINVRDILPNAGKAKPKGLSPEQAATIAGALKKMVVNTNIVVMAAAIDIMGYVPAKLDEDEIKLLQMGWEMWMDELLLKAKLKPVHLVIVGNLMIAVSMFAGAKKKEPKQLKADTTVAKSSIPVATVTPITPPK